MRSSSIALRAAGVAAVLVLAPFAPEARADDAVDVTVSPADAVPGDEVEVLVKGCKTTAGAATSVAFVSAAELAWQDGQRSRLFVETRVKSSVKVGTYTIGVTCDGRKHPDVGVLKVVERRTGRRRRYGGPGRRPGARRGAGRRGPGHRAGRDRSGARGCGGRRGGLPRLAPAPVGC